MSETSATTHPRIDGDEYVPALLSVLNNHLASGASDLYLRHFGIGINEWRILSVLSNTPGSTAGHICETVSMHKAVASRSLRDMEKKDLVRISRQDGQRLMFLTPLGQDMHDHIAELALARERLLLSAFTKQEHAMLLGLLRRMRSNLPVVDAWDPGAVDGSASRHGG
jgi:DNA-binding MarR family transcriptional regulator